MTEVFSDRKDISEFLRRHGGFHDSLLESLSWEPEKKQIRCVVKDVYANFLDMKEYRKADGLFLFSYTQFLGFQLEGNTEVIHIYEMLPIELAGSNGVGLPICIQLSPAGRVEFICDQVRFEEVSSSKD